MWHEIFNRDCFHFTVELLSLNASTTGVTDPITVISDTVVAVVCVFIIMSSMSVPDYFFARHN